MYAGVFSDRCICMYLYLRQVLPQIRHSEFITEGIPLPETLCDELIKLKDKEPPILLLNTKVPRVLCLILTSIRL